MIRFGFYDAIAIRHSGALGQEGIYLLPRSIGEGRETGCYALLPHRIEERERETRESRQRFERRGDRRDG